MKCSDFLLLTISKMKKRFKYLEFLISAEFGSLLQKKVSRVTRKKLSGCLAKKLSGTCCDRISLYCYEYNYG